MGPEIKYVKLHLPRSELHILKRDSSAHREYLYHHKKITKAILQIVVSRTFPKCRRWLGKNCCADTGASSFCACSKFSLGRCGSFSVSCCCIPIYLNMVIMSLWVYCPTFLMRYDKGEIGTWCVQNLFKTLANFKFTFTDGLALGPVVHAVDHRSKTTTTIVQCKRINKNYYLQ